MTLCSSLCFDRLDFMFRLWVQLSTMDFRSNSDMCSTRLGRNINGKPRPGIAPFADRFPLIFSFSRRCLSFLRASRGLFYFCRVTRWCISPACEPCSPMLNLCCDSPRIKPTTPIRAYKMTGLRWHSVWLGRIFAFTRLSMFFSQLNCLNPDISHPDIALHFDEHLV